MLNTLRNATRSLVVRGLLLIVASTFLLYFGSGATMFASLANRPVATVGDIEISQQEFAEAYRNRFIDLGGQITPDQARQFGLPMSVLSDLVGGALVDRAARELGVAVSDAILAAEIRAKVGSLPPGMYENALRQQGLTVRQFEQSIRRDMERTQLSAAIAAKPTVPRALADMLYRYREQRRVVEYVNIPAADQTGIGEPDEAALTEFYNTNLRRYIAPEYHDLTWVALTAADVAESIRISDAEIAAEYGARRAEFTTLDLRGLSQLFFATEADAIAARNRIDGGAHFAEANRPPPAQVPAAPATTANLLAPLGLELIRPVPDTASIGVVRRSELPAEVADAVFALEEGAVSPPLKSVFGWHIYKVTSVQRGGTRPLDEVREQLRADLAREHALREMYSLSITLDDALAGGATLEEAAQKLGVPAPKATIDVQGRDRAGERVATLPPFALFVQTAFRTERGRESRVVDTPEGGYFVLRVDAIVPPAPLPLDSIKDRLLAEWIAGERAKQTQAVAQVFLDKARIAGDLRAEADEHMLEVYETPAFSRSGRGLDAANNLSIVLVGQMFTASVGDLSLAQTTGGGGYTVGRLKEIVAVDPAAAAEAVEAIRAEISADMADDVLSAYQTALRNAYGIRINERAFDQALTAATQRLPTFPTR